MILLPKKQEISSINLKKSKTTSKRVIQVNWVDFYYIKLRKAIKISFPIKEIITYYLSDLSIDINNCIYQFNCFWVSNNLYLTVIKDRYD